MDPAHGALAAQGSPHTHTHPRSDRWRMAEELSAHETHTNKQDDDQQEQNQGLHQHLAPLVLRCLSTSKHLPTRIAAHSCLCSRTNMSIHFHSHFLLFHARIWNQLHLHYPKIYCMLSYTYTCIGYAQQDDMQNLAPAGKAKTLFSNEVRMKRCVPHTSQMIH